MEEYKFKEEQITIIQEYLNGQTVKEIADKRSISREAVYQTLRRIENWEELRLQMLDNRKLYNKKLALKVKKDILEGIHPTDALQKYGLSATTLYRYCPEMRAFKMSQSSEVTKDIAEDWFGGMTYKEISKKYDMFTSNVQRRLRSVYGKDWEKAKLLRKRRK
jgi:predicted DNA-binding protein YlxM (UPF0122 family)